jgi:hypothetical protein
MEGLMVLKRHLGHAPGHWLLTHLNELCAQHPFHDGRKDLGSEFARLVAQARGFLDQNEADDLLRHAAADYRLRLATPDAYLTVHADGWAGQVLDVRFRQPERPVQRIRLSCVNATPGGASLHLRVAAPDGTIRTLDVPANGPFEIAIDLPDRRPGACMVFRIVSAAGFVPAEVEPGSTDARRLAYRVEAVETA